MAATIGPTPVSWSRSGRQERTIARMAFSCSAASASRKRTRRARSRSTVSAVMTSTSPPAAVGRSRAAVVIMARVVWPRKRARTGSGAVMTSACSCRWASAAASTAARRAVSRICSAARSGAGLGLRQPGAGQGVAGGAFGVDRVGLRPGPAGRADRAVQLDDQLAGIGQVPGQAGAVAAGALHRPGPQPRVLLGQGDQLGVAVGIGASPWPGPAPRRCGASTTAAVWVSLVGVDADDDLDQFCQHGHAFSPDRGDAKVPVRCGDGRTVTGHASGNWRSSS